MEIPFPLRGFDKNWAVSKQPPKTTPIIENIRPYGDEDRARGGPSPSVTEPTRNVAEVTAYGTTYDNTDGENGIAQYNFAPESAQLMCLYLGRIVAALNTGGIVGVADSDEDDEDDQFQWYMSRQGDPTDWTYAANDAQSPVAGKNSKLGRPADTVNALVPFKDSYLYFGCESSIWQLRGDPAYGGSLDLLMDSDGVISAKAWCLDSQFNLYFAGKYGIYKMPAAGGARPQNITNYRVPGIMDGVTAAHLEYDSEGEGINIWFTGAGMLYEKWWYDIRMDGFYPESNPGGSAFKVLYGPFRMAKNEFSESIMKELVCVFGGSSQVYVSVYTGRSAIGVKEKVDNEDYHSRYLVSGENEKSKIFRPRARGCWAGVCLSAVESSSFSIEKISIYANRVDGTLRTE